MIPIAILVLALFCLPFRLLAQPGATNRSFVGTVSGFRAESATIEVRPDHGDVVAVPCGTETEVKRVEPGETDLRQAALIKLTDLTLGDRVLVIFTGSSEARRIVVMAASDITKQREADRQDWITRGLAGVVSSVGPAEITLKTRSFSGEVVRTVAVNDKTVYRRYAPDSVRFADAKPSSLSEVRVGDQLRGRGERSPDGRRVEAEEVVFGTFLVKAGSISDVDTARNQITINELGTNQKFVVRITRDSRIKRMPGFPSAMAGGPGPSPARGGQAPGAGPRPGGPGGGMPELSQMIEGMPAATIADLQPGENIVVSSTRGATEQVTAIMLVANADMLIQMATMLAGGRTQQGPGATMGMGIGGLMGGLSGIDLSGIVP